jgi:hypothetical protein
VRRQKFDVTIDERAAHARPPDGSNAMTRDQAVNYQPLQKYLRERHADRVVLTFGQIEDLVGSPLPGAARLERAWWNVTDAQSAPTAQSDAWTTTHRTATVNLAAQSVLFERDLPAKGER